MSIRPLPYSSVIRYYENHPEDSMKRSATLFRESIPGCERLTAAELETWRAGYRRLLEFGIQAASEIVQDMQADEPGGSADASGMMAPPEDPIETTEFVEADLIHNLHQQNYTMRDIYGLLIPEIELMGEGAERAEDRRDDGPRENGQSSGPVSGNRGGSRVDSMFR